MYTRTHAHSQNTSLWIAWIYQYTCRKAQQRRLDLYLFQAILYLFQAILHFTKDSSSLCKWLWQPLPKDTQTHDKREWFGLFGCLSHTETWSLKYPSEEWFKQPVTISCGFIPRSTVALYPGPLWHYTQVHCGIIHRSTVALYPGSLWHYTKVHCGIIHRSTAALYRFTVALYRFTVALYPGPLRHYTQVHCGIIHRSTVALYPGPLRHYTQVHCGIIPSFTVALYTGSLWHYTQVHRGIIHRSTRPESPKYQKPKRRSLSPSLELNLISWPWSENKGKSRLVRNIWLQRVQKKKQKKPDCMLHTDAFTVQNFEEQTYAGILLFRISQ